MNAFSNANIKDKLCGGCDCTGFAPAVGLNLNTGTNILTITDTTTYGTGAARKIVQIVIVDRNAKKVYANIPAADADGIITADVSTLDRSEGLTVQATVISDKGCISDGSYYGLGVLATVGSMGAWDKDFNNITL